MPLEESFENDVRFFLSIVTTRLASILPALTRQKSLSSRGVQLSYAGTLAVCTAFGQDEVCTQTIIVLGLKSSILLSIG
jgi:hypothetical protein